jgi:hypothetical protein
MHIKSVLLENQIESVLNYLTWSKKPELRINQIFTIEINEDKIVITPHEWRTYWRTEIIRLADPKCFEIVVAKMIELRDLYEDYKQEKAEKRRILHDHQISR